MQDNAERLRILEHSMEKFKSVGFIKISMDEIASDLKMSKKTIYKYFHSKEELVEKSLETLMHSFKSEYEIIFASNKSMILQLFELTNFITKFALTINQNFFKDLQKYPEMWQKLEQFREKNIREKFYNLIEQGKYEEVVTNKPTSIIIMIILSSIQSAINPVFLINNNFSAMTAAKHTFEIVFTGILTKKGRKLFKQLLQENENEGISFKAFSDNVPFIS